jgi:hypothetical protein
MALVDGAWPRLSMRFSQTPTMLRIVMATVPKNETAMMAANGSLMT